MLRSLFLPALLCAALLPFLTSGCTSGGFADPGSVEVTYAAYEAATSTLTVHFSRDAAWVGARGWYVLPGDASERSGTVTFAHSAYDIQVEPTGVAAFVFTGYRDNDGLPVASLPAGTVVYLRVVTTDYAVTESGRWRLVDGILTREV